MKCVAVCLVLLSSQTTAVLLRKSDSCAAEDLKHRAMLQNKLAGDCEEMCKEVGAYPKKCTCPDFVQPDSTPGVMTWEELLAHMDNLVAWGKETLKGWTAQAAALAQKKIVAHAQTAVENILDSKACAAQDLKHRAQVQNKLASACIDMCKEIGAYPKCECPGFAPPDSTPGVMTWEELNEHMDNLVAWGLDMIKKAKARASGLIQQTRDCSAKVSDPAVVVLQEGIPNMVYGSATFEGAGQVKVVEGACKAQSIFDATKGTLYSNGGESHSQVVSCPSYPCCMSVCCGGSGSCWQR